VTLTVTTPLVEVMPLEDADDTGCDDDDRFGPGGRHRQQQHGTTQ
jgi:hypothetical protein